MPLSSPSKHCTVREMCSEMVQWLAHYDDYVQRCLFTLAINNPDIKRDNGHAHTNRAACS